MKSKEWFQKGSRVLERYKYVLLVMLVGVALLLWPGEEKTAPAGSESLPEDLFRIEEMEEKLEKALSRVEGAGNVTVALTLRGGPRQVLAQDESTQEGDGRREKETSTILLSRGSGYEEPAVLQQLGPVYQGALVVSSGGDDPRVKLALTEAVSALTGLRTDQISICKGK